MLTFQASTLPLLVRARLWTSPAATAGGGWCPWGRRTRTGVSLLAVPAIAELPGSCCHPQASTFTSFVVAERLCSNPRR